MNRYGVLLIASLTLANPATAADFQFDTLIRLGQAGNSAGNWEFGIGNNSGAAPSATGNLSPDWSSGTGRQFWITYFNSTNQLELRVFSPNGQNSDFVTYTPSGGPAGVGATWTLPSSALYVSATGQNGASTSVNISGLQLTSLAGTVISPTPGLVPSLTAQSSSASTSVSAQPANIVFQGDATGSFRLGGLVTLNFSGLNGNSNQNLLQFRLSGSATAVPEPGTWALMLTGALAIAWRKLSRGRVALPIPTAPLNHLRRN